MNPAAGHGDWVRFTAPNLLGTEIPGSWNKCSGYRLVSKKFASSFPVEESFHLNDEISHGILQLVTDGSHDSQSELTGSSLV